jgi:hypothetical protein
LITNQLTVHQEDLVRTPDQLLLRDDHTQNQDLPHQKEFQRNQPSLDPLLQRDVQELSHLPEKTLDRDPEVLNETEEILDHAHDPLEKKEKLSFTLATFLMIPLRERSINYLNLLALLKPLLLLLINIVVVQKDLASSFTKMLPTTKLPLVNSMDARLEKGGYKSK